MGNAVVQFVPGNHHCAGIMDELLPLPYLSSSPPPGHRLWRTRVRFSDGECGQLELSVIFDLLFAALANFAFREAAVVKFVAK